MCPANRVHQKWMLDRMRDLIMPGNSQGTLGILKEQDYEAVGRAMRKDGLIRSYPDYTAFCWRNDAGGKRIVIKLVLVITICSTLIFAATLGYNYYRSRVILEKELESNARNLATSLVYRVETELSAVTKVTEGVASSLETGRYTERELLSLIRTTVEKNPRYTARPWPLNPMPSAPQPACMLPTTIGKMERSPSAAWKTLINMSRIFTGTGTRFHGSWANQSGVSHTSTRARAIF